MHKDLFSKAMHKKGLSAHRRAMIGRSMTRSRTSVTWPYGENAYLFIYFRRGRERINDLSYEAAQNQGTRVPTSLRVSSVVFQLRLLEGTDEWIMIRMADQQ